ncbi:MAG: VWA domain-containing protein [Cyanobacteriota bacterium]
MKFENPYILFLLWTTPLLILFFIYTFKRRKALLEEFCNIDVCKKIIEGFSQTRRIIKCTLITIAIILLLFALAGPQWGYVWEEIRREGVDIYIALDVSDSMLAKDMSPNRLERAKREIKDFMNILKGDRIGLVIFSGSSFIQCPLTLDYSTIQMFIDNISPDSIPVKGTSIGGAIQTCLDAFKRGAESSSKAIILISDGEDHMGNVSQMAKEAKKQGVIIYAIGLGQDTGSYIPQGSDYKKDLFGQPVVTKANFTQLKEIAKITGGIYSNSVTGNLDIENIYLRGIKKTLKSKELKSSRTKNWIERFQWPLSIALLLILFEYFFRERKSIIKIKKQDKKQ